MNSYQISRRNLLRNTLIATSGVALGSHLLAADEPGQAGTALKGRIKQSASQWCYGKIALDDLCAAGKKMGLAGLDLLGPDAFPTLKKHGLVCTMTSGTGDIIRPADHDSGVEKVHKAIEANAEAGFPNVIVLAGYRWDIPDDDVGMTHAVTFLKRVAGLAEKKGVSICMEYLNSKVDHKGYVFDNMAWGAEVIKRVGSPNVKILYDIYHAQIMEGDIIRTIRTHKDIIGHYHTGGNPGRNEIDETQEIYYPAIMRAILETGYKGYVAHEFVPKRDPLTSLAEAVKICDA
ncbi:MAG: TIM barrel protein [Kiritimatiellae bacterium]|nr:TIM barrel protein [Kiritimatiellia bacterium]